MMAALVARSLCRMVIWDDGTPNVSFRYRSISIASATAHWSGEI